MLTVIGCGNLNRRDDGVGVLVAQRLQERLRRHPVPRVQVFDCGTSGVDVMFKARGSTALLILDASRSVSRAPSTKFRAKFSLRITRPRTPCTTHLRSSGRSSRSGSLAHVYSLHDFRWDHALAAGRKIFRAEFPESVRVWLVEAESLEYGLELSAPVREASEEVYRRLLVAVAEYAAERHSAKSSGAPKDSLEIRRGSIRLSKELYERYFEGRGGDRSHVPIAQSSPRSGRPGGWRAHCKAT